MSRRAAGIVLVVVGLACGYAAIWTDAITVTARTPEVHHEAQSYWHVDGTLAGWLLGLVVLATLGALAWFLTAHRVPALVAAVAAAGATGTFLFYPVFLEFFGRTQHVLAFEVTSELGAGGALGLCTILVAAGVLVAIAPPRLGNPGNPLLLAALALTLAGLGAALAGVWLDLGAGSGSYWRTRGGFGTHDLGIALICLVALGALLAVASQLRPALADAQRVAAGLLLGYTFFIPAGSAWHFGKLGVGAWMAAAGALAFLVGSTLPRRVGRAPALRAEASVDAEPPAA